MDALDQAILARLRTDARESATDIARAVGTSEGTVRSRMRRMQDEGTIRGFTVRTRGADVRALVEVRVAADAEAGDAARQIRAWPGVEAVWETTGDNDLVVIADCPTTARLNDIIDRVRKVPGALATRSRLILKEH